MNRRCDRDQTDNSSRGNSHRNEVRRSDAIARATQRQGRGGSTAELAARCAHSPDLRNEKTCTSALRAVMAMVLRRGSRFALRRSERSTRKSASPSSTVREKGGEENWIEHSGLPDTKRVEEVSFEAEACRAHAEIGAHPHRLEPTLDAAGEPLAVILEPKSSRVVMMSPSIPTISLMLVHPADAVAHALDLDDQVDRAGDLHADRAQRQIGLAIITMFSKR